MTTDLSAIAFKRVPFEAATRFTPISTQTPATLAILGPFDVLALTLPPETPPILG